MIVVPVAGDRIKTKDGLPSTVISYSNYKSEGPAVLVEETEGGPTATVFFHEIAEINDQPVSYIKNDDGYKVFEISGYMERKYLLPQIGEYINSKVSGVEDRKYEVKRLRLNVPNQLSSGLIIDGSNKDEPGVVEITLGQISDIDHYLFSREKFLAYYADYREKGTK